MNPLADRWTVQDVEAVLARGEPEQLLYLPIALGMNGDDEDLDRDWLEAVCLHLARHADPRVRANAWTGIGHLARTARRLNLERVLPALQAALRDAVATVAASADDAAGDLEIFLDLEIPGRSSASYRLYACTPAGEFRWLYLPQVREARLGAGAVFRLPGQYPHEAVVDLLLVADSNAAAPGYRLVVASGYKAGLPLLELPDDALLDGGVSRDWLQANWDGGVYPDCPASQVRVRAWYAPPGD